MPHPVRAEIHTPGCIRDEFVVIDATNEVAAELGVGATAVALAWVHGRPGFVSTLIGARRIDQLQSNLEALDIELTRDQLAGLDAEFQIVSL